MEILIKGGRYLMGPLFGGLELMNQRVLSKELQIDIDLKR